MYEILIVIIIASFVGLLFVNIFFRVRVFKLYKKLVQNNVDFESKHMFNAKLLEEEILPKYPDQKDDILGMIKNMHRSLNLNLLLIFLIVVAGIILRKMQ